MAKGHLLTWKTKSLDPNLDVWWFWNFHFYLQGVGSEYKESLHIRMLKMGIYIYIFLKFCVDAVVFWGSEKISGRSLRYHNDGCSSAKRSADIKNCF